MCKIVYTKEQNKWLLEHYKFRDTEWYKEWCKIYGTDKKQKNLVKHINDLKKDRIKGTIYSQAYFDWLKENYSNNFNSDLSLMIKEKFGYTIGRAGLLKHANMLGVKKNLHYTATRGGVATASNVENRIKVKSILREARENRIKDLYPIGTIAFKYGKSKSKSKPVPIIKVSHNPSVYVYLYRYMYEKLYNVKLTEDDFVVCLKDTIVPEEIHKEDLFVFNKSDRTSFTSYLRWHKGITEDKEAMKCLIELIKLNSLVKEYEE